MLDFCDWFFSRFGQVHHNENNAEIVYDYIVDLIGPIWPFCQLFFISTETSSGWRRLIKISKYYMLLSDFFKSETVTCLLSDLPAAVNMLTVGYLVNKNTVDSVEYVLRHY